MDLDQQGAYFNCLFNKCYYKTEGTTPEQCKILITKQRTIPELLKKYSPGTYNRLFMQQNAGANPGSMHISSTMSILCNEIQGLHSMTESRYMSVNLFLSIREGQQFSGTALHSKGPRFHPWHLGQSYRRPLLEIMESCCQPLQTRLSQMDHWSDNSIRQPPMFLGHKHCIGAHMDQGGE